MACSTDCREKTCGGRIVWMRVLIPGLVVTLLAAAPAAADDAGGAAAAHAAVREALLEKATMPIELLEGTAQSTARASHEHVMRARQEETEKAAHSRAVDHGARHSREAHPEHGAESWMPGSMHGSGTSGGMDSGWDCHDPAENERTRGTHDGWMPPDHERHW